MILSLFSRAFAEETKDDLGVKTESGSKVLF